MASKRDRSDSREPRFGDKSFEERNLKNSRGLDRGNLYANTDQSSIDKTSTCLDGEKAPNPLSSPNSRKSTSPTRHGPEKRLSIDSKAGTSCQPEKIAESGSNQMGTEEYSDFDSDSDIGDYDARDAGTEETPKSPKPDEKETDLVVDGKLPVGEESYANEESNAQDMDINEITDKIRKRNSKHDGLLEGISDEELDDVSDEENGDKNSQKGQSAKLADALGVDWSQLSELKQKQKNLSNEENETDEKQAQAEIRRKRWTPIAIFNRIGIPKSFLVKSFTKASSNSSMTMLKMEKN
jgi:hypothetical protein